MVTMKGEWHHTRNEPMVNAGGHAINIVGYNDHYMTEFGYQGGFILRNTWEDGRSTSHGMSARGSHSAAFFMQSVGNLEDAQLCPNPHSPRSWMECTDEVNCNSPYTHVTAQSTLKVLHLTCVDNGAALPKGACEPGDDYYLRNLTAFGSEGLYTACVHHFPPRERRNVPTQNGTICYPPLALDALALVFGPTDAEVRRLGVNDKDVCGYNFLPYATYDAIMSSNMDIIATSYDIEWTESSYASRAAPGYDYALLEASTHKLKSVPAFKPFKYQPNGL